VFWERPRDVLNEICKEAYKVMLAPTNPEVIPAAGSTDEHAHVAPDLFTAETPLGTYQGLTDEVVLSRTPGAFRTVLVPRGSSKPEWLPV